MSRRAHPARRPGAPDPRRHQRDHAGHHRPEAAGAMNDILYEVADGVAVVTLNRPQALKALTLGMIHDFHLRLSGWAEDPAVRAAVRSKEHQYELQTIRRHSY